MNENRAGTFGVDNNTDRTDDGNTNDNDTGNDESQHQRNHTTLDRNSKSVPPASYE